MGGHTHLRRFWENSADEGKGYRVVETPEPQPEFQK